MIDSKLSGMNVLRALFDSNFVFVDNPVFVSECILTTNKISGLGHLDLYFLTEDKPRVKQFLQRLEFKHNNELSFKARDGTNFITKGIDLFPFHINITIVTDIKTILAGCEEVFKIPK